MAGSRFRLVIGAVVAVTTWLSTFVAAVPPACNNYTMGIKCDGLGGGSGLWSIAIIVPPDDMFCFVYNLGSSSLTTLGDMDAKCSTDCSSTTDPDYPVAYGRVASFRGAQMYSMIIGFLNNYQLSGPLVIGAAGPSAGTSLQDFHWSCGGQDTCPTSIITTSTNVPVEFMGTVPVSTAALAICPSQLYAFYSYDSNNVQNLPYLCQCNCWDNTNINDTTARWSTAPLTPPPPPTGCFNPSTTTSETTTISTSTSPTTTTSPNPSTTSTTTSIAATTVTPSTSSSPPETSTSSSTSTSTTPTTSTSTSTTSTSTSTSTSTTAGASTTEPSTLTSTPKSSTSISTSTAPEPTATSTSSTSTWLTSVASTSTTSTTAETSTFISTSTPPLSSTKLTSTIASTMPVSGISAEATSIDSTLETTEVESSSAAMTTEEATTSVTSSSIEPLSSTSTNPTTTSTPSSTPTSTSPQTSTSQSTTSGSSSGKSSSSSSATSSFTSPYPTSTTLPSVPSSTRGTSTARTSTVGTSSSTQGPPSTVSFGSPSQSSTSPSITSSSTAASSTMTSLTAETSPSTSPSPSSSSLTTDAGASSTSIRTSADITPSTALSSSISVASSVSYTSSTNPLSSTVPLIPTMFAGSITEESTTSSEESSTSSSSGPDSSTGTSSSQLSMSVTEPSSASESATVRSISQPSTSDSPTTTDIIISSSAMQTTPEASTPTSAISTAVQFSASSVSWIASSTFLATSVDASTGSTSDSSQTTLDMTSTSVYPSGEQTTILSATSSDLSTPSSIDSSSIATTSTDGAATDPSTSLTARSFADSTAMDSSTSTTTEVSSEATPMSTFPQFSSPLTTVSASSTLDSINAPSTDQSSTLETEASPTNTYTTNQSQESPAQSSSSQGAIITTTESSIKSSYISTDSLEETTALNYSRNAHVKIQSYEEAEKTMGKVPWDQLVMQTQAATSDESTAEIISEATSMGTSNELATETEEAPRLSSTVQVTTDAQSVTNYEGSQSAASFSPSAEPEEESSSSLVIAILETDSPASMDEITTSPYFNLLTTNADSDSSSEQPTTNTASERDQQQITIDFDLSTVVAASTVSEDNGSAYEAVMAQVQMTSFTESDLVSTVQRDSTDVTLQSTVVNSPSIASSFPSEQSSAATSNSDPQSTTSSRGFDQSNESTQASQSTDPTIGGPSTAGTQGLVESSQLASSAVTRAPTKETTITVSTITMNSTQAHEQTGTDFVSDAHSTTAIYDLTEGTVGLPDEGATELTAESDSLTSTAGQGDATSRLDNSVESLTSAASLSPRLTAYTTDNKPLIESSTTNGVSKDPSGSSTQAQGQTETDRTDSIAEDSTHPTNEPMESSIGLGGKGDATRLTAESSALTSTAGQVDATNLINNSGESPATTGSPPIRLTASTADVHDTADNESRPPSASSDTASTIYQSSSNSPTTNGVQPDESSSLQNLATNVRSETTLSEQELISSASTMVNNESILKVPALSSTSEPTFDESTAMSAQMQSSSNTNTNIRNEQGDAGAGTLPITDQSPSEESSRVTASVDGSNDSGNPVGSTERLSDSSTPGENIRSTPADQSPTGMETDRQSANTSPSGSSADSSLPNMIPDPSSLPSNPSNPPIPTVGSPVSANLSPDHATLQTDPTCKPICTCTCEPITALSPRDRPQLSQTVDSSPSKPSPNVSPPNPQPNSDPSPSANASPLSQPTSAPLTNASSKPNDELSDLALQQQSPSPLDSTSVAPQHPSSNNNNNNNNTFNSKLTAFLKKLQLSQGNDMVALTTSLRDKVPFLTALLPQEIQKEIGIQFTSTFVKCYYSRVDCLDESDFRWDLTAVFGSCFTYNFNDSNIKIFTHPGPHFGLELTLYTYREDFICTTDSTGFKISLQLPTEAPFPESGGIYAMPGVVTSTIVSRVTNLKQDNCIQNGNRSDYYYDGTYTVEGCMRSCHQKYAIGACNCADPRFPKPDWASYCEVEDIGCLENFLACSVDFLTKDQCSCKEVCRETQYHSTVTTSSINFETDAWIPICAQFLGTVWNGSCEEYLRSSMAIVNIYYDRLSEIIRTEEEAYSQLNFLSDLFNWIGLPFAADIGSVVEVLLIIVDVILIILAQMFGHRIVNVLQELAEPDVPNVFH